MANKRFWLGMLALVLVFSVAVVGCNSDPDDDPIDDPTTDNGGDPVGGIPDPRKDYYGTWKLLDRFGMGEWDEIILVSNKWEYSTSDGEWEYTLVNLTWTPLPNVEGSTFYEDYPVGYQIAGILTSNSGTEAPYKADGTEGEIGDVVYDYIYLSNDKSSVMTAYWGYLIHEAAYGPFIKQ